MLRLGAEGDDDLPILAMRRLLAIDFGRADIDARISKRLAAAGFNDPRFDPGPARSRKRVEAMQQRVADSSIPPAQIAPVH